MMKFFRLLSAVLAAMLLLAGVAFAQQSSSEALQAFVERADRVEAAIEADRLSDEDVERERAALEAGRQRFVEVAGELSAARAPLARQIEALGPAPENGAEDPAIAAERARLSDEIAEIDRRLRLTEQGAARATALVQALSQLRRARFEQELFTRGPSPLSPALIKKATGEILREIHAIILETRLRLVQGRSVMFFLERLTLPVLLSGFGLFIAIAVRRWLIRLLQPVLERNLGHRRRVMAAVGVTVARLLLPAFAVALVLMGIIESGLLGPAGLRVALGLSEAALVVICAFAMSEAYFAPSHPSIRLSRLDDAGAWAAARWVVMLATVVALDRTLVVYGEVAGLNVDALAAMNAAVLVLGGIALWRLIGASHLAEPDTDQSAAGGEETEDPGSGSAQPLTSVLRLTHFAARAAALMAPLLALAGYYAASRFIFYPVVFSGALIGVCILIHNMVRELSAPSGGAAPDGSGDHRLPVLPVLTGFLLILIAMPLLALIWGATVTDLSTGWARMIEGFQIGDVVISPVDFVIFIIVFAIGYVLTRVVQGVLRRSVLPVLRMDQGAKSALTAGIGYVGVVVAALVAISTTGLDLSNLAIVAGALSVGIGFGLQNIVNNFVSGIILLVERPIKTGDWVEIAGVHGTVQKVNVRSTEIQTFDRSTMFVPNADLISGTVTNWTHGNSHGRLIVKAGVAYGSDVRKVERILLEVAQAHPMLMRRPGPYVIFTGFGADSLDFEIRGVLRDVNWILNVASDIRFSVYERFVAEGVEIPFAQRDIHIRSLGGLEKFVAQQRPEGAGEDAGADPVPESDGPDGPG